MIQQSGLTEKQMETLKAYLTGYVDRTVEKELEGRACLDDVAKVRDATQDEIKKIKDELKVA